ncbi:uncharacterized protein K452DRAFT_343638 [Aplosporella prunicola CBS 121167]|uniref:Uncharacterized protein n=1 Tax=Aplosporella prunicola CBS 121167 TaxID=1176127 RepID=A0A6A6BPE2_9PEZI|nr:uncharacterized protein K452DRAFT_343638 [Aplosporella prunicola CBS 121167]KAF2145094.1 hypothetical protein K452DRAFT_343638 [Aplosporella prunicola CBS 121167]
MSMSGSDGVMTPDSGWTPVFQTTRHHDTSTEAILAAVNSMQDTMSSGFAGLSDDVKGLSNEVKGLNIEVKGVSNDTKGLSNDIRSLRYDIRDESSNIRKDIHDDIKGQNSSVKNLRNELKCGFSTLREGIHDDIKELDKETHGGFSSLRADIRGEVKGLGDNIKKSLQNDLEDKLFNLREHIRDDVSGLSNGIRDLGKETQDGLSTLREDIHDDFKGLQNLQDKCVDLIEDADLRGNTWNGLNNAEILRKELKDLSIEILNHLKPEKSTNLAGHNFAEDYLKKELRPVKFEFTDEDISYSPKMVADIYTLSEEQIDELLDHLFVEPESIPKGLENKRLKLLRTYGLVDF